MSLEKGTLIGFTPGFQSAATAAAALSSPLNMSLVIRPVQMIFGHVLL